MSRLHYILLRVPCSHGPHPSAGSGQISGVSSRGGVDAALLRGARRWVRGGVQGRRLLSGARPERDAAGAGGRLRGRQGAFGIGYVQVGHPLRFDEITLACRRARQPFDDAREQGLARRAGRPRTRDGRAAHPVGGAVDPVRNETLQQRDCRSSRSATGKRPWRANVFRARSEKCLPQVADERSRARAVQPHLPREGYGAKAGRAKYTSAVVAAVAPCEPDVRRHQRIGGRLQRSHRYAEQCASDDAGR